MPPGNLVRTLLSRWRWIAFGLALGLSLGGTASLLNTPTFKADAQLFVSTPGVDLVNGNIFAEDRAQSYTKLATTRVVLQPVVDRLSLDMSAGALAGEITASSQLNTVVIDLVVRDSQPVRAARIANAVAAQLASTVSRLENSRGASVSPVRLALVEPAQTPSSAGSVSVDVYLALGLVAGLVAGLYSAVLRERHDTRVRNLGDLRRGTDAVVLGEVALPGDRPRRRRAPTGGSGVLGRSGLGRDGRLEGFRRIRAGLRAAGGPDGPRSIALAAIECGLYTSSAAKGLAVALAETGNSVVLVEADLRNPGTGFAAAGTLGLSDVLAGEAALAATLNAAGSGQLQVLPVGTTIVDAGLALASEAMAQVLRELSSRFDRVVLACAPVPSYADSLVLGALVDGVVVVVDRGRAKIQQVNLSLEALRAAGVHVLGLMLDSSEDAAVPRVLDPALGPKAREHPPGLSMAAGTDQYSGTDGDKPAAAETAAS